MVIDPSWNTFDDLRGPLLIFSLVVSCLPCQTLHRRFISTRGAAQAMFVLARPGSPTNVRLGSEADYTTEDRVGPLSAISGPGVSLTYRNGGRRCDRRRWFARAQDRKYGRKAAIGWSVNGMDRPRNEQLVHRCTRPPREARREPNSRS